MRADAAANRDRIVAVARAALERDEAPPMTTVARAASVGQGTLYRHFPTWADLVMAVHRVDVAALVAAAPELLARDAPLPALRAWLDRLAEYGRLKRGLDTALYAGLHRVLADEGTASVVAAIDLLLEAGRIEGVVRPGIDGRDVLQLIGFLWRLPLDGEREERAAALLDVVVEGLRAGPGGAIP